MNNIIKFGHNIVKINKVWKRFFDYNNLFHT